MSVSVYSYSHSCPYLAPSWYMSQAALGQVCQYTALVYSLPNICYRKDFELFG
jgi:hypothetical protein